MFLLSFVAMATFISLLLVCLASVFNTFFATKSAFHFVYPLICNMKVNFRDLRLIYLDFQDIKNNKDDPKIVFITLIFLGSWNDLQLVNCSAPNL